MDSPTAVAESLALPTLFASLPPEVLRRTLFFLNLSDRSVLRQCSRSLRLSALALDRRLLLPEVSDGDSDDVARAQAALRREMIDAVEDRRWLARSRSQPQDDEPPPSGPPDSRPPAPGQSRLRRLVRGDFLSAPIDFDLPYCGREYASDDDSASSCRKYRHQREYRYYSSAQLIDGHIWVLYNDYWVGFEAFDLDTGKALEGFHCAGSVGPDKDYVNDEEERIRLCLQCFAGAHGLLAQGLELSVDQSRNPHGAWSGPYLTVWEIGSGDVRMCVDLYRPLARIEAVSVVARDRVAVLLQGTEGVELQWHRIPKDSTEMGCKHDSVPPTPDPDRPGEKPPDHRCSMNCPFGRCPQRLRLAVWEGQTAFWQEQEKGPTKKRVWDDYGRDNDEEEAPVFSYEVRAQYLWWPGNRSLIQSDQLRVEPLEGYNNASMQCDSGMLVIVAGDAVQVWHVGTMTLLRTCDPFEHPGIDVFHEGIYVDNLSVKTVVFPIEDALGPGEGKYYAPDDDGDVRCDAPYPARKTTARCVGSNNPIDLAECDVEAILARFAHLTYDEQRCFEKGDCGLGSDGSFSGKKNMQEGSCSPQLECIVRVAFSIHNMGTGLNNVVHMDINPFSHIRQRERDEYGEDEEIKENLTKYERACLGLDGLWCGEYTTYFNWESGQCITVLQWERGGTFDFEEAPTIDERQEKFFALYETLRSTNKEECEKLGKLDDELEKELDESRRITSIHIDSHKLIVCTASEVAVLPFSLCLQNVRFGENKSLPEEWNEIEIEQETYSCRKEAKVWHSYRPFDSLLASRWSRIRRRASYDYDMPVACNKRWELKSIAADFSEDLGKEVALLQAARNEMPTLSCNCSSWRYLAFVSSSFEGEGHENLNVYDSIADLVREGGTRLEARAGNAKQSTATEPGIHFDLDCSSDDEYLSDDE